MVIYKLLVGLVYLEIVIKLDIVNIYILGNSFGVELLCFMIMME